MNNTIHDKTHAIKPAKMIQKDVIEIKLILKNKTKNRP